MKVIGSLQSLGPNSKIRVNVAPNNLEYSGFIVDGLLGEDVYFGQCLYFDFKLNKWKLAKSNIQETLPCKAISCENGLVDSTIKLLQNGTIRNDNWNFTSNYIYVSDTELGLATDIVPVTNSFKQVIGTALGTNVGYFDFSPLVLQMIED